LRVSYRSCNFFTPKPISDLTPLNCVFSKWRDSRASRPGPQNSRFDARRASNAFLQHCHDTPCPSWPVTRDDRPPATSGHSDRAARRARGNHTIPHCTHSNLGLFPVLREDVPKGTGRGQSRNVLTDFMLAPHTSVDRLARGSRVEAPTRMKGRAQNFIPKLCSLNLTLRHQCSSV
jgi:hypothetical protein